MASTIANQFTGLPIENLISAPLLAAAEGQKSLASTTAQFISEVGMMIKVILNQLHLIMKMDLKKWYWMFHYFQ